MQKTSKIASRAHEENKRPGALTIRRFCKADSADVTHMMNQLAAFHGEKSRITPAYLMLYALGKNKRFDVIVAAQGATLIGFASTSYTHNLVLMHQKAHTEYLFVEESCRGHGIGKRLVHAAILASYKKGCDAYVISASPHNKLSNRVYKALGLTQKKKIGMNYIADLVFMKRLVKANTPKEKNCK